MIEPLAATVCLPNEAAAAQLDYNPHRPILIIPLSEIPDQLRIISFDSCISDKNSGINGGDTRIHKRPSNEK
jgi:hypothetical protein